MTTNYQRVLPRDLFNEAKLLKCVGKLVCVIEDKMIENLSYHYDDDEFNVWQDDSDGSIYIGNIEFFTHGRKGGKIRMQTPLNSKDAWPLQAVINDEYYDVFNDVGELNSDFKKLIEGVKL